MCGRYTHLLTWGKLVEFSRLGEGSPLPPEPAELKKRYNQAPTEKAPVVRIKDGRRELVMLRWGWGKMEFSSDVTGHGPSHSLAANGSLPMPCLYRLHVR
jgi:putative SOS response-associated peptidase YedK